jgi:hypothetical protein
VRAADAAGATFAYNAIGNMISKSMSAPTTRSRPAALHGVTSIAAG